MARNLTTPTVIKELARVSNEIGVDIFTEGEMPVKELVKELAMKHAFADIPEIAGQITIDEAVESASE